MGGSLCLAGRRGSRFRLLCQCERRWFDRHSVPNFLDSLGDDAVADFELGRFHDALAAERLADGDGYDAHFVFRADNRHQMVALNVSHRTLRNQQGVGLRVNPSANAGKHAGHQNGFGIGKLAHDLKSPGLNVYLVIRKANPPAFRIYLAIGKDQLQRGFRRIMLFIRRCPAFQRLIG